MADWSETFPIEAELRSNQIRSQKARYRSGNDMEGLIDALRL